MHYIARWGTRMWKSYIYQRCHETWLHMLRVMCILIHTMQMSPNISWAEVQNLVWYIDVIISVYCKHVHGCSCSTEPIDLPDHYNTSISGAQLGRDFLTFHDNLRRRPYFKDTLILGPDIFYIDKGISFMREYDFHCH